MEILVERALSIATKYRHEYVTLEHLLLSLLHEDDINTLIGQCDVKEEVVKTDIVKHIQQGKQDITLEKDNVKPRKTASLDRVFHRAFTQVIFAGRKNIEPKDLLVSLLSEGESYAFYFLMKNGLTREVLVKEITK